MQAMPTAFIAKSDEEADVAALWAVVWEDSGSSAPAALRLYMADIVPLLISGVLSPLDFLHLTTAAITPVQHGCQFLSITSSGGHVEY